MSAEIHLLLVEDDRIDQMAFKRAVERQELPYAYTIAGSVAAAQMALKENNYDVILVDYLLGDGTAFELFDAMQAAPFIVMTGSGDEDIAVRAMKAGAYDYLTKDPQGNYLTTLPLVIEHAIERWRTAQELEQHRAHLEALVAERTHALRESERRYRTIFETVPVSVWEEDFSGAVKMLEDLRTQGVNDIAAYLNAHPEFVEEAARHIYVRDVNEATVHLFGAESKAQMLGPVGNFITAETLDILREELTAIAEGRAYFKGETVNRTLQGEPLDVLVTMRFPPRKSDFDRVLVSVVDITERKRMEATLRESERRYRAIFETTGAATILIEEDMTISLANRQCEALSGYTRQEIEGKMSWTAFVAPEDLARMREYHVLRRRRPGAAPQSYEFRLITKSGERRNVHASISMIPSTTQSIASILDITDRVRTEQALERRIAQLGLINKIGAQIAAVLDLDRLLDRAAQLIQETFGYHHVGLFLLDQEQRSLHLHSKAGGIQEFFAADHRLQVGQGIVGWVAERQQRLLVNDVAADERYLNLYPDAVPTRAELSVPVRVGEDLVGVLDVQSPQRDAFDADDILVLETLADQIAVAIENARLHEAAQQELEERRRAEAALRESRRMLTTLLSNLPGMAYRCHRDAHWTMEFVSEGCVALTGYTPSELVDNRVVAYNDLIHPEDRAEVRARVEAALEEGRPFRLTYRLIRADGEQRWAWEQGRGVPDEATGEVHFLEGFIIDVTERMRAEAEREVMFRQLQEQTQRLQQILNTVSEGMLLLDADKNVLLANPVAREYLEILNGAAPDGVLRALGPHSLEGVLTQPDRGLWHEIQAANRIFEVAARPLAGQETPAGWTLVLRDVTREREMQERLQQQARLAAIGQLAAGIAHDFNNIMAVIVLYADILLRSDLPSQAAERLSTIIQQANHASDLIDQLLDFSRRAVFERRPMDLLPFLKEQVKLYRRTLPENIDLHLQYDAGEHLVNADPTRIQQVIMNLVVNARDAMPKGGQLLLNLERFSFSEDELPVPTMGAGEWIRLDVRDTGMGMSEEVRSHLFEPFFTTKQPGAGSGLGLAQVYGIVKQHEGEITVTTEEGKGTTFHIYLPALETRIPELESGEREEALSRGRRELLLVVEDNASTREALVSSLEMLNYRTLEAADGAEALDLLAQHPDIDLVLTDVVMRNLDGVELLRALEEKRAEFPVILLSGHPADQSAEALRAVKRPYRWLTKPIDLHELADALAEALGEGG
ncbi:MAG: PAS domain S-box protein [Anaerolineae bacterium]